MVVALSLLAALVQAGGSVVQQRTAEQAPPELSLSPRLLVWLVRRPLWVLGVVLAFGSNVVFAAAVAGGAVAVAEALFVSRLVFALAVNVAWDRHRVPLRDGLGVVAVTAGVAVFVLALRPQPGVPQRVPGSTWVVTAVAVVVVGVLVALSRRLGPARTATVLASGAACLFALQAVVTSVALTVLRQGGILALLTTWSGWTVVTCALVGMLLLQSAYEAAPLPASYPPLVSVELLAGVVLGTWVLGGTLSTGPLALALGAAGLALTVGGIRTLATSALVTGDLPRLQRLQTVGRAAHTASRLERELRRLDQRTERTRRRVSADIERLDQLRGEIRDARAVARREQDDPAQGAPERARLREQQELLNDQENVVEARAQHLAEQVAVLTRPSARPPR